jgi:hypothetical protein
VFAESGDGFNGTIRSVVAGADCALDGAGGPCESALCRLKDGRLLCVFRLASFARFGRCISDDEGKTWSHPTNIPANSVEPSLQVIADEALALSCGRPGISVWFANTGTGEAWQEVDIPAQHNDSLPADRIQPNTRLVRGGAGKMMWAGLSGFTSSYTELLRLDDVHLLLMYDRLGMGWSAIPNASTETNSVWVMRLGVES